MADDPTTNTGAPATDPAPSPPPAAPTGRPFSFEDALKTPDPVPAETEGRGAAPTADARPPATPQTGGSDRDPATATAEPTEGTPPSDEGDEVPAGPERGADGKFVAGGKPGGARAKLEALEARYGTSDPDEIARKVAEQAQAEQARVAEDAKLDEQRGKHQVDVERYERLRDLPDNKLSSEDYSWRETFKERLDEYPEVVEIANTLADRRAAARIQQAQASTDAQIKTAQEAFNANLLQALSRHVEYEGVDAEVFGKEPDWGKLGDLLYEGGRASRQVELDAAIARAEKAEADVAQYRFTGRGGLGAARTAEPGRSTPANETPTFDPNRPPRENLAAAFSFGEGANGRH